SGNIAPHPHYSSTTHMDSQTLPTHSVLFLFLLIQTIFAMGRCCNLSTRSTRRNPLPIAPTATALPYTYSTSYLPPSPLPISTRPTSSRWVPPYVPWFCLRFLPD